jgi:2-phosphosulfolactate phosphatase
LCAAAADSGSTVLVGCLRTATAVAGAALELAAGGAIGVVPGGERWGVDVTAPREAAHSGPLRPAVEDLLGAGAIASALLSLGCAPASVEATIAAETYERTPVADALTGCVSGRELIAAGHAADVALAAQVDISTAVPRLHHHTLRAH